MLWAPLSEPLCRHAQLALQTRHWTWLNWVTIFVGPAAWFLLFAVQYNWNDDIFFVSERDTV
jgi:hypothetical protein